VGSIITQYDSIYRRFEKATQDYEDKIACVNFFAFKAIGAHIVKKIDENWHKKVFNLEEQIKKADNYIHDVYARQDAHNIVDQARLSQLHDKNYFYKARMAFQALKEGSAFNELKDIHDHYNAYAQEIAQHVDTNRVAEFMGDQQANQQN